MKQFSTLLFCLFLFSGLAAQNLPSYLPANGLVGWWPFNGNANNTFASTGVSTASGISYVNDRSGNLNSAVEFLNNGIVTTPIPQSLSPGNSSGYSISFWIKRQEIGDGTEKMLIQYKEGVLGLDGTSNYDFYSSHPWCSSGNALFGHHPFSSSLNYNCSPESFGFGVWKHFILIFNQNNLQVNIYKDGLFWFSSTINSSVPNEGFIIFGNNAASQFPFLGQLDDIAIYNRALTQQEITALYQAGNPTSLQYQLQQQKEGNCPTSPVRLSVKTQPRIFTDSVGSINAASAMVYGSIPNDGGQAISSRGICWSTSPNSTTDLPTKTQNGSGIGSFSGNLSGLSPNTTYYARVYAISSVGTWYGNELTFTTGGSVSSATCGTPNIHNPNLSYGSMSDQDGNVYKTIIIGTQEWMAENLKTGHYRNGEVIPVLADNSAWSQTTSGASCWYNNDSASFNCPYGRLYNWYSVADPRGLCPVGWHSPGDDEWKILETYVGIPDSVLDEVGQRGGQIQPGKKMKSNSIFWIEPNAGGTNLTGFSVMPSGFRDNGSSYELIGVHGFFWSNSILFPSTGTAQGSSWNRDLINQNGSIGRYANGQRNGFSVRCLKDESIENGSINSLDCGGAVNSGTIYSGQEVSGATSTISYTGGSGGNYSSRVISSTGVTGLTATLAAGSFANGDGSFSITISGTPATTGIANFALSIGGQSCSFSRLVVGIGGGVTDIDGNTYGSVIIGNQEWMSENLKVSKYGNGDPIPTNLTDAAWQATTSGAYAIYNNDSAINGAYGKLYNWYAVADQRGLCPAGWHVPNDGEWKTLEINLGMSPSDADLTGAGPRGEAQNVGGKLKSTSSIWFPPNSGATNESGFSGFPGGGRLDGGGYDSIGLISFWWSSTGLDITNSWNRYLNYSIGSSGRILYGKLGGFSVRCLKD